ncbi:uncharacterized protein LOC106153339 [Lingula anatina]|uniref:Uncharacterized protein LOC106153339 n=1 Tax=Lingula anatina TaxID=7574 RepID=A0A1S3H9B4_LINAN|nr:uncharacterized protein LOC106153339 [Lingula anatina]|eukprot:XP_013382685.1 uncharacterized protein LOC106153339 [Lingula anatina]
MSEIKRREERQIRFVDPVVFIVVLGCTAAIATTLQASSTVASDALDTTVFEADSNTIITATLFVSGITLKSETIATTNLDSMATVSTTQTLSDALHPGTVEPSATEQVTVSTATVSLLCDLCDFATTPIETSMVNGMATMPTAQEMTAIPFTTYETETDQVATTAETVSVEFCDSCTTMPKGTKMPVFQETRETRWTTGEPASTPTGRTLAEGAVTATATEGALGSESSPDFRVNDRFTATTALSTSSTRSDTLETQTSRVAIQQVPTTAATTESTTEMTASTTTKSINTVVLSTTMQPFDATSKPKRGPRPTRKTTADWFLTVTTTSATVTSPSSKTPQNEILTTAQPSGTAPISESTMGQSSTVEELFTTETITATTEASASSPPTVSEFLITTQPSGTPPMSISTTSQSLTISTSTSLANITTSSISTTARISTTALRYAPGTRKPPTAQGSTTAITKHIPSTEMPVPSSTDTSLAYTGSANSTSVTVKITTVILSSDQFGYSNSESGSLQTSLRVLLLVNFIILAG